jgi:hypothetical protein
MPGQPLLHNEFGEIRFLDERPIERFVDIFGDLGL